MKHSFAIALIFLGTSTAMAAEPESPGRVDPLLDCSTPVLDADTPEEARLLHVQYGADALVRELRETYAARLAAASSGIRRRAPKAGWCCA